MVSEEEHNFSDLHRLAANHPVLIFIHFLTVAPRISVNYLYKNLTQRWHEGPCGEPVVG